MSSNCDRSPLTHTARQLSFCAVPCCRRGPVYHWREGRRQVTRRPHLCRGTWLPHTRHSLPLRRYGSKGYTTTQVSFYHGLYNLHNATSILQTHIIYNTGLYNLHVQHALLQRIPYTITNNGYNNTIMHTTYYNTAYNAGQRIPTATPYGYPPHSPTLWRMEGSVSSMA